MNAAPGIPSRAHVRRPRWTTSPMRPRWTADRLVAGGESLVSWAGAALLIDAARSIGLSRRLSQRLRPWRAARSRHDPGAIVLDLAIAIAWGVTVLPIWPWCVRRRTCSGRRPRIRRCHG
jgi:hypothetical protein